MKRFLSIALLVAVWFTMTACGKSQGGQNSVSRTENDMPSSAQSEIESLSVVESISAEDLFIAETEQFEKNDNESKTSEEASTEMKMKLQVGDSTFTAVLENNAAVDALVEMMKEEPVVIKMSDYSGFEKVGALGKSLPANNSQTTTEAGDIVLYQGNQIVIFYGSNSWSYTRLGRIENLTGWEEALGRGDVTVTFSLEEF